jgi:hypothetical protein
LREQLAGANNLSPFNKILPLNATDEQLLEAFFNLDKGTIKAPESYFCHIRPFDCSKHD